MAITDNALFMARNEIDLGTVTASTSVTAANLVQNMRPGRMWRGSGKVEEYVQVDLGAVTRLRHLGVVGHNLDTQGIIQWRGSDDATFAAADVFDTGETDAWDPVAGFGFDNFGESLGGYPLLTDFNDYRPYWYRDIGSDVECRYLRMYMGNSTNSLITGVGAGWIYAGVGDQFDWNFDFGWGWDWLDPSEITPTETSVFVRRRKTERVVNLAFEDLSEAEAIGAWNTMQRALGKSRTMLVVPFPTGGAPLRYATSIYGLKVDGPGIVNPSAHDLYTSGLTIKELVK